MILKNQFSTTQFSCLLSDKKNWEFNPHRLRHMGFEILSTWTLHTLWLGDFQSHLLQLQLLQGLPHLCFCLNISLPLEKKQITTHHCLILLGVTSDNRVSWKPFTPPENLIAGGCNEPCLAHCPGTRGRRLMLLFRKPQEEVTTD